MNCKKIIKKIVDKKREPMSQFTYWLLFITFAITLTLKVLETAASVSYQMILDNPDMAVGSWLANAWFL